MAKGKSWGGHVQKTRHVRLEHSVLRTAAYRSLTPNARALLMEFAMLENGKNNGELFMSVRDAADRMGVGDPHTAGAALAELESAGFIALTKEAHFAVKAASGSRSRCWRLTWQSVPALSAAPTNDFTRWQPQNGKAHRRAVNGCAALDRYEKKGAKRAAAAAELQSAVRFFHTHNAERVRNNHTTSPHESGPAAEHVRNNHTQNHENAANPPKLVVRNNHTHTTDQLDASTAAIPRVHVGRTPACEDCGEPFKPGDRGKPKRFCSETCRKRAERQRAADRRKAAA
jgi:hypothetical protein